MKIFFIFSSIFLSLSLFGQTTYNLDWHLNFKSPATDRTVKVGDTVIWTWTDSFSHTVQSGAGSVETFNSGVLNGVGTTYSHTFTSAGVNPYFCGVHGAGSMSGTITVATLGVHDSEAYKNLVLYPNPVKDFLVISNNNSNVLKINILDSSGRKLKSISKFEDQKNIKIKVANLENGLYNIEIETDKGKISKKFIKK